MDEKKDTTTPQDSVRKSFQEMFLPNDFCKCLPPFTPFESPNTTLGDPPGWLKTSLKERKYSRIHHKRNNTVGIAAVRGKQLRTAVSLNDTERVHSLLQAGIDANSSDGQQRSPLHLAACKGFTEIINLLLQFGADPNLKDTLGNTPLHLAACTNNIKVVTLLLDAGTDISSLDKLGRNPLHLAQSKLRLIQQVQKDRINPDELVELRQQIQQVVNMMISFLHKKVIKEAAQSDLDELSNKLNKLKTSDIQDVDLEVSQLLDDLQVLELNKT